MTCRCSHIEELWDDEAKRYADEHLIEVELMASGWETLYRCPETGVRWLEDHPRSNEHGGGPTRLRVHRGWPPDAPLNHDVRVRELSTGRIGSVRGHTQSADGVWQWAGIMDDDERVWMVSHADARPLSEVPSLTSPDELWERVAALVDGLTAAGEDTAARCLGDAMTRSAHPGEVWPETRAVLLALIAAPPRGLDEAVARSCVKYLGTWP